MINDKANSFAHGTEKELKLKVVKIRAKTAEDNYRYYTERYIATYKTKKTKTRGRVNRANMGHQKQYTSKISSVENEKGLFLYKA